MIHVLHGEDQEASYRRLTSLLKTFPNYKKIQLLPQNSTDFNISVISQDLFEERKIIICENFLKEKKIKPQTLKDVPASLPVIFWEKSQLRADTVKKLPPKTIVEIFKPPPILYNFLDTLEPGSRNAMRILPKLESYGLLWNFSNRILLLILAKDNLNRKETSKIAGRELFDWQWDKIQRQAQKFPPETLYSLFSGSLKIDYMIKTGATQMQENFLLSMLLSKYLHSPTR